MKQKGWKVYLDNEHIDTVYYSEDKDPKEIVRSLIKNDGYSSDIIITEDV